MWTNMHHYLRHAPTKSRTSFDSTQKDVRSLELYADVWLYLTRVIQRKRSRVAKKKTAQVKAKQEAAEYQRCVEPFYG